jgi:hypothetical protein
VKQLVLSSFACAFFFCLCAKAQVACFLFAKYIQLDNIVAGAGFEPATLGL